MGRSRYSAQKVDLPVLLAAGVPDFIIHGAVMVQDIGLEVIGEGSAGFRPAWRVGSVLRPVVMAQLGV